MSVQTHSTRSARRGTSSRPGARNRACKNSGDRIGPGPGTSSGPSARTKPQVASLERLRLEGYGRPRDVWVVVRIVDGFVHSSPVLPAVSPRRWSGLTDVQCADKVKLWPGPCPVRATGA
ncbi:hypothetical protein FMEAI12_4320023 [Parafrankia sp. Ea1.12]|nr:hypothetical protein FMEAI12_4320023 [Parafrankia sp. Ea1.12]